MSASRGQPQPQWQAARVPKLSYRKPLPPDELDKITSAPPREYVPPTLSATRTISARENVEKPVTLSSTQAASKKKGSILSGFFSKEPTISALAQVEADLTAKHGSATPQTVPHVSSRKMPEHVPKVNSKWDGVPEMVKLRERDEKHQRKRLSQQNGIVSPQQGFPLRDSDDAIHELDAGYSLPVHQKQIRLRRESDVDSQTDSWRSRSERYTVPERHGSFSTATSSNPSVEDKRRLNISVQPQSLRSPSGRDLPEITSFFPHHQTFTSMSTQTPPTSYCGSSARIQSSRSINSKSEVASSRGKLSPSIGHVPEHSSSPAATPRELSPATPIYCDDKEVLSGDFVTSAVSAAAKNNRRPAAHVKHVQIDAFLAGEAKPVEFDDDSEDDESNESDDSNATDRTRLPLRQQHSQPQQKHRVAVNAPGRLQPSRQVPEIKSSRAARFETAPWEKQEPAFSKNAASILAKNRVPKALAGYK